jgi:peptidoglycan/LPS O-acetylase OafA/YrhL
MATTKERLDQLTRHLPEPNDHPARMAEGVGVAAPRAEARPAAAIPRPATATVHTPIEVRLAEPISTRWALLVAVAWVVLLAVGIAVEPPPTNPNAVDPWFVSALATLLLGALLTTLAGLGMRRRWSLAVSLMAAGMLVLSTVLCPVSGHHTGVGGWWVVQLGCAMGLVATSILAWRRATPP